MSADKKKPAPRATPATKTYIVLSPISHDGVAYTIGEEIELTDSQAAPLTGYAVQLADTEAAPAVDPAAE